MTLTTLVSPDQGDSLITAELHQLLDLRSVPGLRIALLKALARSPDAIIVDVSALRAETRTPLAVFAAALHTHGYPPVTLVLCGATGALCRMLGGGILRGIATCSDYPAALSAVTAGTVAGVRRMRLGATPATSGLARGCRPRTDHRYGRDVGASCSVGETP